ncbi:unnamed protein product [Victoria cruziana]
MRMVKPVQYNSPFAAAASMRRRPGHKWLPERQFKITPHIHFSFFRESMAVAMYSFQSCFGPSIDPGPRQLGSFSSPVDSPFPPLVKGTRGGSRAGEESEKEGVV